MGVSNDGLWQGTLRDFDHAIPPGCTSPWDGGRAGFSTILTCRVRYYCWRSGLLNMGLLTDLILILILKLYNSHLAKIVISLSLEVLNQAKPYQCFYQTSQSKFEPNQFRGS